MAHVGIEGLGPGHRQEDRAQDDEAEEAVLQQEDHPVIGVDGPEHRQVLVQME
jgi:hypothetical protein